jgi:hypothetical protein
MQSKGGVVGLSAHDCFTWGKKFQTNQQTEDRTNTKEGDDAPEVEQADTFMVSRKKPAKDTRVLAFIEKAALAGCRSRYITVKMAVAETRKMLKT